MTFWIVVGIVALGIMVLVHEFGHFVMAKWMKVRVRVFSIGIGPRLFGIKRGDTDYRFSWLPLGGYLGMVGENPLEERSGAPDEFLSKPLWRRTIVVLGGPVANILAAVLVMTGLFYYHYERAAYLDQPAVIGAVVANSPAEQAGLQPGDRIVRLGNLQDPTWQKLSIEAALTGAGKAQLEIEREGERLPLDLTLPENVSEDPFAAGWIPDSRPVVQAVVVEGPAHRAGLQVGDVLLELDGEPLRPNLETNVFSDRLQETEGGPVAVTILRDGDQRAITITPEFGDHPDGKRWIIGIQMGPQMVQKELSFPGALQASIQRNVELTGLMLTLVGRLVTGRASLQAVQGPVGIVYISGQVVAQGGLLALLNLAAVISLSLGVLNLLPIPILDGGHLLTFAIEAVLRRELSLRFKERMVQVGLVFLVLLFVVVMYNDIARILTN